MPMVDWALLASTRLHQQERTRETCLCVSLEIEALLRGPSRPQSPRCRLPCWGVKGRKALVSGLPRGSRGHIYLGDEGVQ